MCTLQTRPPSAAARAVADVPGAIVTAKHTNAQAKARELIMIFVNFVFIVCSFFSFNFCCFGLLLAPHHERSFLAVHLSTWQDLAVRYAEKTETLRTTDCTDIPDKGNARKQKETKVAKVIRNQVRPNHLCFLRYLLLEKKRFGADRSTHSCCPRNPWSDYFGASEATIFSKRGFFSTPALFAGIQATWISDAGRPLSHSL